MRLSLATRNFLGYAAVLLTFGAVSIFSVSEMRRNQQIRLVSQGYTQLSQDTAAIDTFFSNQMKDTERLAEEPSVETRRALIRLARLYSPSLMSARIAAADQNVARAGELSAGSETAFVRELGERFRKLAARYGEYQRASEELFTALEAEHPESAGGLRADRPAPPARDLAAERHPLPARVAREPDPRAGRAGRGARAAHRAWRSSRSP